MRTTAYPEPPSPSWTRVMVATYSIAILMGLWTFVGLFVLPQAPSGVVVLGGWGLTAFFAGIACLYGVLSGRYRFEWIGAWGIVLGTVIYLLVTVVGTLSAGALVVLTSGPTILFFAMGTGLLAARALWLSMSDKRARERVVVEREVSSLTGEFPEVRPNES